MSEEPHVHIEDSAHKWGVSDNDIRHALAHSFNTLDLINTVDDTEKVMVLGYDSAGNELEVGVLLTPDGLDVIHAKAMTAQYEYLRPPPVEPQRPGRKRRR